jgi:hypothetical protein
MRIITVTRKPVEGSTTANVVENQAGVLNIDACRVTTSEKMSFSKAAPYHDAEGHQGRTWNPTSTPGVEREQHQGGRWPANVILQHQPDCEIIGERNVSTGTAHRERSGGKTIFSETDKKPLPNMSYANPDGTETIPAWACTDACPVAVLDIQSGSLTSGTGAVKRASSKDRTGNRSATYGAESRAEGTPIPTYGDTGGASRFFKQLGGRDQPT